ncbi:flippase [Peribacillus aracenensis]|uniref:flippase n=1 Tax=Peribacillus aracenensis TaxID=2976708 RepID=UPI0021A3AB4C|nr:flippase [Peribacillus sp. BBB004]
MKNVYAFLKRKIFSNEVASKTIKNSSWLVSDKIFTMLIGLFITAIIARYFGPEDFGQFNYALAFVSLFTALSTLGLETLTVKKIIDKDIDEGTILCTSLILRVTGGLTLTTLATMVIMLIEPNSKNLHMVVIIMSLTMVFKSCEVIEYWLQTYQKAKVSSIIRMSVYIIIAALKIALVFFSGNLIHYALIYLLDSILIGFSLIIAYFRIRKNKFPWRFSLKYTKSILSQSWYLILSGLMITLYMRIDQVMLGFMLPNKSEAGIYSAAVRVAEMWYFVPMAIITSFNPIIMSKKRNNENSFLHSIQLLFTLVAWVCIGFGLLILIFSEIIISLLYGHEFIKASGILTISVWAGTFALLGSARSTWLISEGLQKYTLVFTFAGCITNITLNYWLIPTHGGFGAACATLISQIVGVFIIPVFFNKTRMSTIMMIKAFNIRRVFNYIKQ